MSRLVCSLALSCIAVLTALGAGSSASAAVVSAAEVVDYQPGSATTFTDPAAALGLPAGDTTFGALTPFNPPFRDDQIVIVGAGGRLTLRLSSPVSAGGAEPDIGIFVNNGLIDVSASGSGVAGTPAATFSPLPAARVSVSEDGETFVPLGAGPVVFSNPTNFYTDVTIANYSAPVGSQVADFAKPFAGSLPRFNGLAYADIVRLLDGSAGGTWIDASGAGLATVNFVRFDVETGEGDRLVLDAVTAVPEPGATLLFISAGAMLARRRRRIG